MGFPRVLKSYEMMNIEKVTENSINDEFFPTPPRKGNLRIPKSHFDKSMFVFQIFTAIAFPGKVQKFSGKTITTRGLPVLYYVSVRERAQRACAVVLVSPILKS